MGQRMRPTAQQAAVRSAAVPKPLATHTQGWSQCAEEGSVLRGLLPAGGGLDGCREFRRLAPAQRGEAVLGLQRTVGNDAIVRLLGPVVDVGAPRAVRRADKPPEKTAPKTPEEKAKAIKQAIEDSIFSASEDILTLFSTAASPGEFIEIQKHLDMPAVIDELKPFAAVRMGTLGPVVSGADKLNRKRADYIVEATHDYGPAEAEVFVHYMINSMYTNDITDVLKILAADKRLGATIDLMESVKKLLTQRGIKSGDFKDRDQRASDFARGLGRGLADIMDSSPGARDSKGFKALAEAGALPKQYAEALDAIKKAELHAHLEGLSSPKNLALAALDEATLGAAGGLYGLVAGTTKGVVDLAKGDLEAAGQDFTPAVVLLATYLGAKAYRVATTKPPVLGPEGPGQFEIKGFQGPIPKEVARLGAILALNAEGQAVGGLLLSRFGQQGSVRLARWVQADSRAALFVHEHGLAALEALEKSGGDLAKAQAMTTPTPPAGGQPGVVVNWDKPLSASGYQSTLSGDKVGVFDGQIPGVKEPVVVKVYPEGHPVYERDLRGAEAAGKTGVGPKFYGEVDVGPGKKAFAMEKVPGGFPDTPPLGEALPEQAAAATKQAAQARAKVGPQTIRDVQDFGERYLKQGRYYFGELQGLIDENGRWRPIDFQGTKALPPEAQAAEREAAIKKHNAIFKAETDALSKIAAENKGSP